MTMALDTIYSVGEGRTVVVAVDGCTNCLNAFEEFLQKEQEVEDRIVVVIKGGRQKTNQGHFSGPLLLSGTPRAWSKTAASEQTSAAGGENDKGSSGIGEKKGDCHVRNRVVVPGVPLTDFADWDRTSRTILAKLASRGETYDMRFEAIRVLSIGGATQFVDAVLECCQELEADLLVVASHKSSSSPSFSSPSEASKKASHRRTLSSVVAVNPSCPVMVLGKKPGKGSSDSEEEEGVEFSNSPVDQPSTPRGRWVFMRSTSLLNNRNASSRRNLSHGSRDDLFADERSKRRGSMCDPEAVNDVWRNKSMMMCEAECGPEEEEEEEEATDVAPVNLVPSEEKSSSSHEYPDTSQRNTRRPQPIGHRHALKSRVMVACRKAMGVPQGIIGFYFTP